MDNQKFILALDRMLEKTNQGKLEWETTANENTFLAILQDSAISLTKSFEMFTGYEIYIFGFRNENGEEVESVEITKTKDETFEKAKQIFKLARQQSLKIDKTLDHILEQLAA